MNFKKIKLPIWPIFHKEAIWDLLKVYISKNWSWWGKYEIRFIRKFLQIHPAIYAITTVSGTTAIESSLIAMEIKSGDEVIVPAYTWLSTATAVIKAGATPVFVDIDKETLCISPTKIEEAITERTKAIIPVHLFSSMTDMEKIQEIAKKYNLKVIEDCAQVHGMEYKNKAAGTFSDAAIFSFQQSKLLTAGEGGIVITNNRLLAEKIDKINHIGCSLYSKTNKKDYNIVPNKNVITEFQAAVLYNQCNYFLKETTLRQKNAQLLETLLKDVPNIRFQKALDGITRRSFYHFIIIVDSGKLKENATIHNIINELNKFGLCAQNVYGAPVYEQMLWTIPEEKYIKKDCPIAEKISKNEIIAFPHTLLLTNKKTIKKAAGIISETIRNYTNYDI